MPRLPASLLALLLAFATPAQAQHGPGGPQPVGVVRVERAPVTETSEFIGRVQAPERVNLVARVTAYVEKIPFIEGAEVNRGDLLYGLEKPPFVADIQAKAALVSQAQAQYDNAEITLRRAEALLHTPAGQQSNVDTARANELSTKAQLMQAQANLRLSQINLDYTDIRAPIAGKIGRTAVTVGNVVGPGSGTLASIVSQDPMYVVFPVSVRTALELRQHYAAKGGLAAMLIRLRLPDGRIYGQSGKIDFIDNSITQSTDTIALRGVIPNPLLPGAGPANATARELTDGEFVGVILEGVQPVEALTVPRAAVLADQAGDYVFVVDAQNKAEQRRIALGQSTPSMAVVMSGLKEGEMVVLEGLQRVRPGQSVLPGPATPAPSASAAGRG